MKIFKSEFIKSSNNYKNCPQDNLPEYAFIGRSNVGKSSLLNMLVNNKKLSKTSSKPGKTKLINHFKINPKNIIALGDKYPKILNKVILEFHDILNHFMTILYDCEDFVF